MKLLKRIWEWVLKTHRECEQIAACDHEGFEWETGCPKCPYDPILDI